MHQHTSSSSHSSAASALHRLLQMSPPPPYHARQVYSSICPPPLRSWPTATQTASRGTQERLHDRTNTGTRHLKNCFGHRRRPPRPSAYQYRCWKHHNTRITCEVYKILFDPRDYSTPSRRIISLVGESVCVIQAWKLRACSETTDPSPSDPPPSLSNYTQPRHERRMT